MLKCTKKQLQFLGELIADPNRNQSKAYEAVYPGAKNPHIHASRLMAKEHVKHQWHTMLKMQSMDLAIMNEGLTFDQASLIDVLQDPQNIGTAILGAYLLDDALRDLQKNVTRETMLQGTGKGKQKIVTIERELTVQERSIIRKDIMKMAGLGVTNVNVRGDATTVIINDEVDEDGNPL